MSRLWLTFVMPARVAPVSVSVTVEVTGMGTGARSSRARIATSRS